MYGLIRCKQISLPFGKYRYEYELIDDPPYMIDALDEFKDVAVGQRITIGAYRLFVTKQLEYRDRFELYPDTITVRIGYQLERLRRLGDNLYKRCILTLYVWGLARHNPGQPPSWRDIKVFKRK